MATRAPSSYHNDYDDGEEVKEEEEHGSQHGYYEDQKDMTEDWAKWKFASDLDQQDNTVEQRGD